MRRAIYLLLLAVFGVFSYAAPVRAQAAAVVFFKPGDAQVGVQQDAVIELWVDHVENLYGFEVHFRFDPAIIQIVDANMNKEGTQVGSGDFLSADFEAINQVDNVLGTLDYAVTQLNPAPPATGSGCILRITVRGLSLGGETAIRSIESKLAVLDENRQVSLASFTFKEGRVKVVYPATAVPTLQSELTADAARLPALLPTENAPSGAASGTQMETAGNAQGQWLLAMGGAGFSGALLMILMVVIIRRRRKPQNRDGD